MELHIVIDSRKDLAGQVYRQIRAAILGGRLTPGEQLPPSRLLATQLGLSRKTVSQAYEKLTVDKLLAGRAGAGTFVADIPSVPVSVAAPSAAMTAADLAGAATLERWRARGMPLRHPTPAQRSRYDFIGGATKGHFPHAAWRACMLHGLRAGAADGGFYGESEGLPALRAAIARHAAYSRGVVCTAADVIVTNGAQQALDLIGRVLLAPGSAVAMEDPGYPPARMLFAGMGATVHAIPVDAEGMLVDRIPDGTRLIYATPAHQFPLGMPMSPARRGALLQRARQLGAIVIEDDYDSEFRYEGRPTDSLQSMDRAGLVAFVGTFSKVMLPSLRIGYMIAPPALKQAVTVARQISDWHTPDVMQGALAKFIDDGLLQKHVRRCNAIYAARRARLLARLAGDLSPWLRAVPATAGYHLSAMCVQPVDLALLLRLGRRADLGLYALTDFYDAAPPAQGLLFGYGAIDVIDIDPALDRLKTILAGLSG